MMRSDFKYFRLAILLWAVLGIGCTGHFRPPVPQPAVTGGEHFVIVTVTPQDTPASLAAAHLGSADRAWWITSFHQIEEVTPGQQLVIPLQPPMVGGLSAGGYQTVPVLLYERIDPDGTNGTGLNAAHFEMQMRHLRENGYVTATLDRLQAHLTLAEPLPPNAVVITFDSPHRWVYDIAYPILQRYGHTAALFVPAEQVGKDANMDWEMLSAMAAGGIDIGVQALSGKDLTRAPPDLGTDVYLRILEDEIRLSRQTLEDHLQRPCLDFAYPGGATNDLIVALLKQYGYRAAFTRKPGENPFFIDPYRIHRTPIGTETADQHFADALTTFISTERR